jgi:hypothetical protein
MAHTIIWCAGLDSGPTACARSQSWSTLDVHAKTQSSKFKPFFSLNKFKFYTLRWATNWWIEYMLPYFLVIRREVFACGRRAWRWTGSLYGLSVESGPIGVCRSGLRSRHAHGQTCMHRSYPCFVQLMEDRDEILNTLYTITLLKNKSYR